MLFEGKMFVGLANRVVKRMPTAPPEAANLCATFVAGANYPKGARKAIPDFWSLPPIIPQQEVWAATEAFVDRGEGSINDLFVKIWGIGVEDFLAKFMEAQQGD